MPASLHCPRQHCHPWPIPPRLRAERSLRAVHPSKWRQDDQDFLLPVAFAERDHLRGVAPPGARSVEPSRVGRADPEQVNVGARTLRRQLPEQEFVPSVPDRHALRLGNAMDEPRGGLQTYFTAGEPEVRAWTIHRGDAAPAAAGVIHTDFERGFIRAETVGFDDFIANG